jgi:hypothetical protein
MCHGILFHIISLLSHYYTYYFSYYFSYYITAYYYFKFIVLFLYYITIIPNIFTIISNDYLRVLHPYFQELADTNLRPMHQAMTDKCPGVPAKLWDDQASPLYEAKTTYSAERILLYT